MRKHTFYSKGIISLVISLILCHYHTVFAQVTAPTASVGGGRFTSSFTVALTNTTPGTVIRYTLDGSTPDSLLSPQYLTPIIVDKTTVLRAKAFAKDQVSSRIITHTYFFNINHTFPVIALTFNKGDFFNDTTGIYTNYRNNLSVPTHIEFFEKDSSSPAFSQMIDVEIQGSASAELPQKSLDLKPKKAYGVDNFPYKMFPDLPYNSYKRLLLRNNGQDWGISMFRDDLVTSLATKIDDLSGIIQKPELYTSSYRPAMVYFNGEFWGIYSIKERMKTTFVEQRFNLKSADYDMTENETERINGDSLAWDSFYKEIDSGIDYSNDVHFDSLKNKIHLPNFLDYNAYNIYIDNEDWPCNNVRRFRANTIDKKWRWISYDFDFTLGLFQVTGGFNTGDASPNAINRMLTPSLGYFNNQYWGTLLFRKCMENAKFRRDFINRTADMMNTIFKADRVVQRIDEFKNLYEPERPYQTAKWGTPQPELWIDNLNKMKSFATNRKNYMLEHFNQEFEEVTGTADVVLNIKTQGTGSIRFSTVTVNNSGWSGTYFKGIDIPVKAIPTTGYKFSHWEGLTLPAIDSVNIKLTDNILLTAIFIPIGIEPCSVDVVPPTFQNCPSDITLSTSSFCATATWVNPEVTDNCSTAGLSSNFTNGSCFPLGTTTVIYTAKDAQNNNSNCRFNIIVNATTPETCITDFVAPRFQNCPSNITLTTSTNCAVATWAALVATDNCTATPTIFGNLASGNCFPIGTTEVSYGARDSKGNIGYCSFMVTVSFSSNPCSTDTEKPVFQNCPSNINVTTNSICAVATWTAPSATDNCGTPSVSANFNSGNCFPLGTTTVTYTANDAKNNVTTCSFNINVTANNPCLTDTEKPVFQNCPANMNVTTNSICAVATWTAPSATDNCSTPSVSANFNSGNCFPLGTTTVTYTANDAKNNATTCSFNINVTANNPCFNDTEKPVFQNCPANMNVTTNSICAVATWTAPSATDNCSTPSVSANFNSGNCFPLGTTTVTYTANDAKNNVTTCSFNINVTSQPIVSRNDIALNITSNSSAYRYYTNIAFTVTATNNSAVAMNNVKIEFPYPTGTVNGGLETASLGTWSAYCPGGVLCYNWNIPNLPANGTATLNIPLFILNPSSPLVATATLISSTPNDDNAVNNKATISIPMQQAAVQNLNSKTYQAPSQYVPIIIQNLYPNPTDSELLIDLESIIQKKVSFYVSNTLGKTIKVEQRDVQKGMNQVGFDMSDLQSGVYFIVPETNIGRNIPTKFVKL